MVWVGRYFKDHQVPASLLRAGTPSTKSSCSKPYPIWTCDAFVFLLGLHLELWGSAYIEHESCAKVLWFNKAHAGFSEYCTELWSNNHPAWQGSLDGELPKEAQSEGLSWKHFSLKEMEFQKPELLCDNTKHLPLKQKFGSSQDGSAMPVVSRAQWCCCLLVSRMRGKAEERLPWSGHPTSSISASVQPQPTATGKILSAGGPAMDEQSYLAHVLNPYSLSWPLLLSSAS